MKVKLKVTLRSTAVGAAVVLSLLGTLPRLAAASTSRTFEFNLSVADEQAALNGYFEHSISWTDSTAKGYGYEFGRSVYGDVIIEELRGSSLVAAVDYVDVASKSVKYAYKNAEVLGGLMLSNIAYDPPQVLHWLAQFEKSIHIGKTETSSKTFNLMSSGGRFVVRVVARESTSSLSWHEILYPIG